MTIDAVEPTNSDSQDRRSVWEKLKPIWWLRGVIAAFAVVGLADQLGFIREDWLRVIHAIGARWHEIIAPIAQWLSLRLPFGLVVSPEEMTAMTIVTTLMLPAWISVIAGLFKSEEQDGPAVAVGLLIVLIPFLVAPFLRPDAIKSEVVAGIDAITAKLWLPSLLYLIPVFAFTSFYVEKSIRWWHYVWAFLPVLLFMAGAAFNNEITMVVSGLAICAFGLFMGSRTYLKALIITLTFIATLEAFYLVPIVQSWMKPAIEWIDPFPLHEQPPPFATRS